jgi:hypothetical protein
MLAGYPSTPKPTAARALTAPRVGCRSPSVRYEDMGESGPLRERTAADGATAPETLRRHEPCRQDNLERDACHRASTEGDIRLPSGGE